MFEQLEGVVYRLQQERHDDVLVVSCEPTIAMKWLIPRLPDFHRSHPHIQVQLLTAGGPIDFARSGADLAIRRDDFHWDESVHAVTICQEWIGPVCLPSKKPESADLRGACLLRSKTRPLAWDNWLRLVGQGVPDGSRVDYEHFYLCIQAALAGQGIGMASFLMVQSELESGQLIAPFGFTQDGSTYCLLSPRPFENCANSTAFRVWLTEAMSVCRSHR
jgi:DNA-binding transcriptional LysR family regulator